MILFSLFAPVLLFGQAMRIDPNGKVFFNGQTGKRIYTPQVDINTSDGNYAGNNGTLNLCNTNRTNGNTARLSFLTYKDNGEAEDFTNIITKFLNLSASFKSSELH